ncbi:DUF4861 family protein [Proteiniphilum acetatigenes]|uniref:DUF4861 family protein n=1 Tax=Proteiniphilum acetatigenes TaxID=294710 RepID=UPI0005C73155|nr:DUF4861 family protein [Proteiniphilum acetatigenes]SFK55424.1 protein of unknown function [Porphyromonadaceae bacterium KH3CP3RA]
MQIRFLTLLLATAIFIACSPSKQVLTVEVNNPGSIDRENEMVEIAWETVQQKLSLSTGETIIITDGNGQQLPYQLVTNGTGNRETFIFPVSLQAGQTASFQIVTGEPEAFTPLVYGRLVPERKDDFTWENNRSAFRVYGPALKATGEISNGMDFWAKKTESLIIDKWYKDDLAGVASYHEDHGEGLDFYKVGRTLGLGMTAPVDNDTLCLGDNFVTTEILDNGPLRITFKLTYDPYKAGGKTVTETRIISLDAYTLFNKVTNIFEVDADELTVATGIVMEKDKPEITYGDNSGIIAYETPTDNVNGTIYTAAIHPGGFSDIKVANGHYLGLNNYLPGSSYTYYAGGGWSKAGFDSFEDWTQFVKKEKEKIDHPLTIQIK